MFKNNLLALFAHICIVITIVFILTFTNVSKFVSLLSIVFYFFIGSIFSNRGSKLKNLLSVSVVTALGLVIWMCDFIILESGRYSELKGVLYFYYNISQSYALPSDISSTSNGLLVLWISFIPMLLMWLGLEWKVNWKLNNNM